MAGRRAQRQIEGDLRPHGREDERGGSRIRDHPGRASRCRRLFQSTRPVRVLPKPDRCRAGDDQRRCDGACAGRYAAQRSEEHTSELQSLMRISYAVFCLKKKTDNTKRKIEQTKYKYYAKYRQKTVNNLNTK